MNDLFKGLAVTAAIAVVIGFADAFKRSQPFHQYAEQAARTYGVSAHLLLAIAWRESNFNPNKPGAAGEIGITQILPIGAADVDVNFDSLRGDVQQQFNTTAKIIRKNLSRFNGDLLTAIRAYNAGYGNVKTKPGISTDYMVDVVKNMFLFWFYSTFGVSENAQRQA